MLIVGIILKFTTIFEMLQEQNSTGERVDARRLPLIADPPLVFETPIAFTDECITKAFS